ncbi:MAG: hypothetical protein VYC34_00690 [Planctomycetota bacterium]|nr:hypothetical protein [Planctomycetota bacterium]
MRGTHLILAGGLIVAGFGASASGGLVASFALQDHPDGNISPPPYGVRFDNFFAGAPYNQVGDASFSFDTFNDVVLNVFEDAPNDFRIVISGTVYGGIDVGGTYGFGEGAYDLMFEYEANVVANGTGWEVSNSSAMNNGTMVSQGNPDVPLGATFNLMDSFGNPPGLSFAFLQDDHRLEGHPPEGMGYWVGRGWFSGHGGDVVRDFFFIGIPAPGAGVAMLMGAGLAMGRRRR